MRRFNVTGLCVPGRHYMADTSGKLAQIMKMVEYGDYFIINRARQYGKTTMVSLLRRALSTEYTVIQISLECMGYSMVETEADFCQGLLRLCANELERKKIPEAENWVNKSITSFERLDSFLTEVCRGKKYVLIVDKLDRVHPGSVCFEFLGHLRDKLSHRNNGENYIFHSVIFVGIRGVKEQKLKMPQDGEAHINPSWRVTSELEVDMSLSVKEIVSMLVEYENDHKTGMDIEAVAKKIREYTNGYPLLVSYICQNIDENLDRDWTPNGVKRAVKLALTSSLVFIVDFHNLYTMSEGLRDIIYDIMVIGKKYTYNPEDAAMKFGLDFGLLIQRDKDVLIGNKIFEMLLYRHFTCQLGNGKYHPRWDMPYDVISGGRLNMQLLIEKFTRYYCEICENSEEKFIENECRMLFLTFLVYLMDGYCHVDSETRDERRMDVVVDYGEDQFIIELKKWRGESKHEDALDQIAGYLDRKNKDVGYLLTFDFRKEENIKTPRWEWVEYKGKRIFDVMVGV